MAFKSLGIEHLTRFNSAISSDFLTEYEDAWKTEVLLHDSSLPSKTFAPSSFRCKRRSWFRLRGVIPDVPKEADLKLDFSAQIGTACHRVIQSRLKDILGDNWISPTEYINLHTNDLLFSVDRYKVHPNDDNLESKIEIDVPPIHFACDGIISIEDKIYLLEIKTCEFSTWDSLTEAKSEHIDQIKCYCALLGIHDVLMLYQDRYYGGIKCFESHVSNADMQHTKDTMLDILDAVQTNIAPEGLPVGDKWCSPSMCPYYKKCQEYGRYRDESSKQIQTS